MGKKLGQEYYWIYFGLNLIANVYSVWWDYYMDWGLFRGTKKDNWWLRD